MVFDVVTICSDDPEPQVGTMLLSPPFNFEYHRCYGYLSLARLLRSNGWEGFRVNLPALTPLIKIP